MLTAKSMAYILVGCIALMLPIKATLKKNKKYLPIITIVSIISVIILILGVITVKNTHIKEDARAAGNISVSGQINSILHNPVLDIKVAANHIKNTFLNMNWYKMLHDDKFFTENCQVVLIPLMLFMLYVAITEDDYNFKISNKVVMILTFLFVYGMTSLVLYLSFSPVGSLNIGGYQTRYIIPILPLLLFCLSSNNIIVKNKENRNFKEKFTETFTHPKKAMEYAMEIYGINGREADIIRSHMFPFTTSIPKYAESWVVVLVDKTIGSFEFCKKFEKQLIDSANIFMLFIMNMIK